MAAAILSLLALLLPLGLTATGRGTKRFLDLGIMQAQPAEFARIALILFLASYLARRRGFGPGRLDRAEVAPGGHLHRSRPGGGAAQSLLGPAHRAHRFRAALSLGPTGREMALERFRCWVSHSSCSRISSSGSRIFFSSAVQRELDPIRSSSPLIALAPVGSPAKVSERIAEVLVLTIFPIRTSFSESWGRNWDSLGSSVLFTLFGIVIYRGFRIARLVSDPFSQLVAAGITLSLALNFLLHSVVVLGVGPVTGVPLPFISHGGTSLLVNMAAVGLLLSISRNVRPSAAPIRMNVPWAGRPTRVE